MNDSESIKRLTLEWTRAQPSVERFIRSFVRHRADADDVLQEVALTIVDRFDDFDVERSFEAWALGIAKNLMKAHFRKQLRQPVQAINDEAVDQVAAAFEELSPRMEDMKEALADCLSRVPGNQRHMLSQQYEQGLKPSEIAERLGKSANHVAVILHRLRTVLRECVERKMNTGTNPA